MTDSPRRVLIVDDDAVFRDIVFQTLHGEGGYEVESVADALDAMEALQWRTYDAIILDLRMGVFDGERMIDFLQRLRPEMLSRVIVVTGVPNAGEILASVPIFALYAKPVQQSDLLEAVALCVEALA